MHLMIVEDYPPVARHLGDQLRALLGARIASLRVANDLDSARRALQDADVDLLFLDLDLGGEDGFDVLGWVSAQAARCIVVSANAHRAIEAFEHGVLDFVPKPTDSARLALALQRCEGARSSQAATRLAVRRGSSLELIAVERILRIQAAGKYSELILRDGSTRLHDKNLERLEQILPEDFVRVHRSHLLRLSEIASLQVAGGARYGARLRDGTEIPIGRTRYRELRSHFD